MAIAQPHIEPAFSWQLVCGIDGCWSGNRSSPMAEDCYESHFIITARFTGVTGRKAAGPEIVRRAVRFHGPRIDPGSVKEQGSSTRLYHGCFIAEVPSRVDYVVSCFNRSTVSRTL